MSKPLNYERKPRRCLRSYAGAVSLAPVLVTLFAGLFIYRIAEESGKQSWLDPLSMLIGCLAVVGSLLPIYNFWWKRLQLWKLLLLIVLQLGVAVFWVLALLMLA